MKNNQRNDYNRFEELAALHAAKVLETQNQTGLNANERHISELGQLIRQSASIDLPESNPDLRDLILNQLESASDQAQIESTEQSSLSPVSSLDKASESPSDSNSRKRFGLLQSRMFWSAAATVALAIGGWWLYNIESPKPFRLADGTSLKYQIADENPENSGSNRLSGNRSYRYESRTRKVPVTRMVTQTQTRTVPVNKWRTETRTRQVPVTKLRTETRTKKLPDGSTKDYEVNIPYTEQAVEQYTVKVPYTENVTQSPTVQVPVTTLEDRRVIVAIDELGNETEVSPDSAEGRSYLRSKPAKNPSLEFAKLNETVIQESHTKRLDKWLDVQEAVKEPAVVRESSVVVPEDDILALGSVSPSNQIKGEKQLALRAKPKTKLLKDQVQIRDQLAENADVFHRRFEELKKLNALRWHEKPSGESYAPIHENSFKDTTGAQAVSTFSVDVDTASYANMRRFINRGQLPPPNSVRLEELINYFDYDYPQPEGEAPFSVNMELATCPWNNGHKLLRVGLKGKEIHADERPATNIVFLIDVSGSMNNSDKLPLLKKGFQMMVNKFTENDRVTIVTYAGNAGVALEPTVGSETKTINEAIESLTPGGSTHGSAGIKLAYELAQKNFIHNGVNKVILATDGDLNVGVTQNGDLVKLIKEKAAENVFLTVLGFGSGNIKDDKMEALADNGNGMYAYIDGIREAHKVLVQEMSGSLVTIAKDVKIQIEFNPAEVTGYRLIGYENRMLAAKDFNDDKKDAGEIGAGHTATAIYELMTTDTSTVSTSYVPANLKYQKKPDDVAVKEEVKANTNLSSAAKSGELLTLALRYKKPDESVSKRIEFTIKNDQKSFNSASSDFQFAASVASFGMLLRNSKHKGETNSGLISDWATNAIGEDKSGYRTEFLELVRKVELICAQ